MRIAKDDNWMYIIRTRLGLSQRKFASLIGLSVNTISGIENDVAPAYSSGTFARLEVFELCYDIITNLRTVPEDVLDDEYFDKLRKRLGMEEHHGEV